MTDLMFLLLIFMLIATTLINPNALKVILPKGTNQLKEKALVTVSITEDSRFAVDQEIVPFEQLESTLQSKLEGVENPTVSIHGDIDSKYGEVAKVLLIARDNKYTAVLAITPN